MSARVCVTNPSSSSRPNSCSSSVRSAEYSTRSPKCGLCGEQINDVVVQALGKSWHQEHFLCAHCNKPITSSTYNVYGGKSYCEKDYGDLFLKKCSACGLPIKDFVIMALGKPWHQDHFTCADCSTGLSTKGFYEKEKRPYCQQCFEGRFCPKCAACSRYISDTAVLALGKKYHETCFRCAECNRPVTEGKFKITNGKTICEKCF